MEREMRRYLKVASSRALVDGREINYELFKSSGKGGLYLMRIKFGKEMLERTIACEALTALDLYSLIVRNLVTPCTLDYILEDLQLKIC